MCCYRCWFCCCCCCCCIHKICPESDLPLIFHFRFHIRSLQIASHESLYGFTRILFLLIGSSFFPRIFHSHSIVRNHTITEEYPRVRHFCVTIDRKLLRVCHLLFVPAVPYGFCVAHRTVSRKRNSVRGALRVYTGEELRPLFGGRPAPLVGSQR